MMDKERPHKLKELDVKSNNLCQYLYDRFVDVTKEQRKLYGSRLTYNDIIATLAKFHTNLMYPVYLKAMKDGVDLEEWIDDEMILYEKLLRAGYRDAIDTMRKNGEIQ